MKSKQKNLNFPLNVVIERDSDDFFIASIPELPGCHTQAKSLDDLIKRIREAAELYIEIEGHPQPSEFIGVQKITACA